MDAEANTLMAAELKAAKRRTIERIEKNIDALSERIKSMEAERLGILLSVSDLVLKCSPDMASKQKQRLDDHSARINDLCEVAQKLNREVKVEKECIEFGEHRRPTRY